ncbi:MAG: flagellar hook-length control protein FliK [Nitrospinaceae bacterium]
MTQQLLPFPTLKTVAGENRGAQLISQNRVSDAPFDQYLEKEIAPRENQLRSASRAQPAEASARPLERRPEPTRAASRREDVRSPQAAGRTESPSRRDPVNAVPSGQTGSTNPTATPEEQLVHRLKELNIDAERIQTILNNIRQGPGAEGVMQALADFLGALTASGGAVTGTASAEAESLQALTENFQPGSLADTAQQLQAHRQKILEILTEAGLTRQDAQRFLAAARQGAVSEAGPELLAQLVRATRDGKPGHAASKPGLAGLGQEPAGILSGERPTGLIVSPPSAALGGGNQEGAAFQGGEGSRPHSNLLAQLGIQGQTTAGPPGAAGGPGQNPGHVTLTSTEGSSVPLQGGQAEGAAHRADGFRTVLAETYGQRSLVQKPVAQQIIEQFSIRGTGNHKEIFIKLDPPSLGTVRMNVTSNGEHLKTILVAENHLAKQAIESNLAQLKDALSSQGVKVDSFTVVVGGNPDQASPHQRQGQAAAFRPFGQDTPAAGVVETPADAPAGRPPAWFFPSQTISLFA